MSCGTVSSARCGSAIVVGPQIKLTCVLSVKGKARNETFKGSGQEETS